MFTLTRAGSAVLMAVLAVVLGQHYQALVDPLRPAGRLLTLLVPVFAVIGWAFLGGAMGRVLWRSVWAAMQAVVLAAVAASLIAGVQRVFAQGYRRQYPEVSDALLDIPAEALTYLARGLDRDFVILALCGAAVVGACAHLLDRALARRRLAR